MFGVDPPQVVHAALNEYLRGLMTITQHMESLNERWKRELAA